MSPIRDESEQGGPATPFERGFFAFFMAVVLGLFVAEIIHNYHPTKLFALFFILWWVPLVAVHEAGHAVAAWMTGSRVRLITIGLNKLLFRFRAWGVPVEFRAIPLGGSMSHAPHGRHGLRGRSAFVYFAGPGAELLLVLVLLAVVGPSTFFTYSEEVPVLALQACALAAVWGAVTNLIPFAADRAGQEQWSDGMGIWKSLTLPRAELEARFAADAGPREDWKEHDDDDDDGWRR